MNIEVEASAVIVDLEQAPKRISRSVVQRLLRIGMELEKFVKTEELSGQRMKVRTGTGRRSVFHRLAEGTTVGDNPGNEVAVYVGSDLAKAKYMRAQEQGATIGAKNAANLTIPVGEAKTGNGVGRFTARQVIASPGSFGFTGTFFRNHVLFGKRADKAVPLFVLKPRVTLKPVGFLKHALVEKGQWIRDQIMDASADGINGR